MAQPTKPPTDFRDSVLDPQFRDSGFDGLSRATGPAAQPRNSGFGQEARNPGFANSAFGSEFRNSVFDSEFRHSGFDADSRAPGPGGPPRTAAGTGGGAGGGGGAPFRNSTGTAVQGGPLPLRPAIPSGRSWTPIVLYLLLLTLIIVTGVQWFATQEAARKQIKDAARADVVWLGEVLEATSSSMSATEAFLSAQAARHRWQSLRLLDTQGRPLWSLASSPLTESREPIDSNAFARASVAGHVAGSVTRVELELLPSITTPDPSFEYLYGPIALVVLALASLALAWHIRNQQARAAESFTLQANAVRDGRLARMPAPAWAELRPVANAMNVLVDRLNNVYAVSTEQIEALRVQAHVDPLTGLSNRRHFMTRLELALADSATTPRMGLLLLRVRDLKALDRRVGRAMTDRVLKTIAQTLQAYAQHVDGCTMGRLNGSDFALLLPAGGVAQDTAQVISRALRVSLVMLEPSASVSIGSAELDTPMPVGEAIALADEALAEAESGAPHTVALATLQSHPQPLGEREWRLRLIDALGENRVQLKEYPVYTPDGRLLHLDCPLHVQLHADGEFTSAQRWLAFATRSRLCAYLDERAVDLALQAIARDGQPRCINLAAQSLGVGDLIASVTKRLAAMPEAAKRLWIDVPESLALDRPGLVQEAARRWRPLGVNMGLEHAGEGLARIQGLMALGLNCVRVDASHHRHIGDSSEVSRRRYLMGLVRLVQSAGLSVIAEGVGNEKDLAQLWALGFDAATGPALRSPPASTHNR